jgi:hypothetical protein
MIAIMTRSPLTFREDVLGRARVLPRLTLVEHQLRFTNTYKWSSASGENPQGAGGPGGGVMARGKDVPKGAIHG